MSGLTNILSWKGRTSRLGLLARFLLVFVVFSIGAIPLGAAGAVEYDGFDSVFLLMMGFILIWLSVMLPALFIFWVGVIRRLHELDRTGWGSLFLLVPSFNILFIIYLLLFPPNPASRWN